MTDALALIALGLPIGFLIGLIGIGGVLLAPTLVHVFGRDIHEAVSLSLASFVLAGLVAVSRTRRADAPLRGGGVVFLVSSSPGAPGGVCVASSTPSVSPSTQ